MADILIFTFWGLDFDAGSSLWLPYVDLSCQHAHGRSVLNVENSLSCCSVSVITDIVTQQRAKLLLQSNLNLLFKVFDFVFCYNTKQQSSGGFTYGKCGQSARVKSCEGQIRVKKTLTHCQLFFCFVFFCCKFSRLKSSIYM